MKIPKNYGENRHRTNSKRKISIWRNPVLEGLRYLKLYHSGHYPTYETIAKKHDVTRARICQMIALAKKLPSEISDLFIDSKNSDKLRHITERKLRPITLMKSDDEKIAAFEKMISNNSNSV